MDNFVRITTTIPEPLWRQAITMKLKWHKCLRLGVESYLGMSGEVVKLKSELEAAKRHVAAIKIRIEEAQKEEEIRKPKYKVHKEIEMVGKR